MGRSSYSKSRRDSFESIDEKAETLFSAAEFIENLKMSGRKKRDAPNPSYRTGMGRIFAHAHTEKEIHVFAKKVTGKVYCYTLLHILS
ncbi:hypothetical protein CDAR_82321 [Caerostris darwini]|uniref:Uncharacterized protein n=1 Tax=Caerostris darwini TaxID=1538125 RepID=A0AAV4QCR0_9ARAC|nr:hypothetical protein CDAR_82321 [Caerostris darwini]